MDRPCLRYNEILPGLALALLTIVRGGTHMKGLVYGCAIAIAFALAGCSEAQFSSVDPSNSAKADPIPVDEVPQENLDDYVEVYQCDEHKKRTCNRHDSEDKESVTAKKALVCHVPNGNPRNRHEICISANALKAHIDRHGRSGSYDYFGPCR